jgi:hypothetical protein
MEPKTLQEAVIYFADPAGRDSSVDLSQRAAPIAKGHPICADIFACRAQSDKPEQGSRT